MNNTAFFGSLPLSVDNDPIVLDLLDGYQLAAPKSFWAASEDTIKDIVNGCGPAGILDILIPDTVFGLNIKAACKVHDWMFTVYNDEAGFALSNQVFWDNMERINRAKTNNTILRWLRSRRIRKYYLAVKEAGRLFYYDAHTDLYESKNVYSKVAA